MPVMLGLQLAPPLVLLNRPIVVPAYSNEEFVGSTTMACTVSPVITGDQLVPPLVVLKIPPPEVPAYRVAGANLSMARVRTFWFVRAPVATQFVAPLMLLKTPPPKVPA